ncbi:hypothetical protein M878_00990 [Streptomyces roseochromogenus subsp. oscitans DS 12.976]|uniref:Uncharacterized protein n=1 Tax=Streptomyces roseochromogenus subsp. oscitans DS 12.976 TaxID=1352936 RepID=V6KX65_STRRC|nr:hypothetical protein M878_00990 [Streptomyces roseochromogenus subsp. oscitans DS 12.976]
MRCGTWSIHLHHGLRESLIGGRPAAREGDLFTAAQQQIVQGQGWVLSHQGFEGLFKDLEERQYDDDGVGSLQKLGSFQPPLGASQPRAHAIRRVTSKTEDSPASVEHSE